MRQTSKRVLKIYDYSSDFLHQTSRFVTFPLSNQTKDNIAHTQQCFKASIKKGIFTLGLAAPQVGILQRFFIIPKNLNISPSMQKRMILRLIRNFQVYINPKILSYSSEKDWLTQSCLSVQESYQIERSRTIEVQYFNMEGEQIKQKLTGLRARIFLHENDHLNGITIKDLKGTVKVENQAEQKAKS